MVLTDIDDETQTGVIVLRPNNSWGWRANVVFLFGLHGCIADHPENRFSNRGRAWVVLPFSLLEISVVGYCLYYCVRQCSPEVITVS